MEQKIKKPIFAVPKNETKVIFDAKLRTWDVGSVVQLVISPEARCPVTAEAGFSKVLKFLSVMYYVYIIESEKSGVFYKGSTGDYYKRLSQHNEGINKYTKGKGPWRLIFVQEFETRAEALAQEKKLKRCNKEYLRWLITQSVNILNRSK